jgi:hypothetical protein
MHNPSNIGKKKILCPEELKTLWNNTNETTERENKFAG